MSHKLFNFNTQNRKGKAAESLFQEFYPEAKQMDGLIHDFELNGEKVEVKGDYYDPRRFSNFFIETVSNDNTGKKGGIFRSLDDKIDWFVYLFVQTLEFHWFKVPETVKFLNKIIDDYPTKVIWNRNYNTEGKLIPIKVLSKVLYRLDDFSNLKK